MAPPAAAAAAASAAAEPSPKPLASPTSVASLSAATSSPTVQRLNASSQAIDDRPGPSTPLAFREDIGKERQASDETRVPASATSVFRNSPHLGGSRAGSRPGSRTSSRPESRQGSDTGSSDSPRAAQQQRRPSASETAHPPPPALLEGQVHAQVDVTDEDILERPPRPGR